MNQVAKHAPAARVQRFVRCGLIEKHYDNVSVTAQAAWSTTRSPAFNIEGRGCHPAFNRAARISSAVGKCSHTATAVTPPNHVVSYTRTSPSRHGTITSWVNSSWTISSATTEGMNVPPG